MIPTRDEVRRLVAPTRAADPRHPAGAAAHEPAPRNQHPDIFWGLAASFWIGNVLLLVLNIPMIGL